MITLSVEQEKRGILHSLKSNARPFTFYLVLFHFLVLLAHDVPVRTPPLLRRAVLHSSHMIRPLDSQRRFVSLTVLPNAASTLSSTACQIYLFEA